MHVPGIPVTDRRGPLATSFAQRRLWFTAQLDGVGAAYHIPLFLRLSGPLDRDALSRSWQALVARHESLRTRFDVVDGEPRQWVEPADERFALRPLDLTDAPDPLSHLDAVLAELADQPFDLVRGPLARARLVVLGAREHVLAIVLHHIIADGTSMTVLARELGAYYTGFSSGTDADPLAPLPIQYADFAAWQRGWLTGRVLARQEHYWRRALRDAPQRLELPTDRPRPAAADMRGGVVRWELDTEVTAGLRAAGARQGANLYMAVLAGWAVVLARLARQSTVVIGIPAANRRRAETENLIGFFVNTLPVRVDLAGAPSGSQVLRQVRDRMLDALEHQDLPFEHIVALHNPARSPGYSPVVQVMCDWQHAGGDLELPGLATTTLPPPHESAKFDLSLSVTEHSGRVVAALEYATALFDADTALRQTRYLRRVLAGLATRPERPVTELALLPPDERERLVSIARGPEAEGLRGRCLHHLVEAQAAKRPEAVAVVHEGRSVSYAELNAEANQLARHLREHAVRPDRLVAICAPRSPQAVMAVLAVLKAGGAYLPLDPAYPAHRLEAMLRDSRPAVVLTAGSPALPAHAGAVVDLDRPVWHGLDDGDLAVDELTDAHLAYAIYTSGTTGDANGVLVEHRSLMAVAAGWERDFDLRPGLVHLQVASFSFDVFTADVVRALGFGGTLVLCPRDAVLDSARLYAHLREHSVGFVDVVPAVLNALLSHVDSVGADLRGLETVVCGSDVWTPASARRLRALCGPDVRIVNAYGVTEAAVDSTRYLVPAGGLPELTTLPIGTPVPNVAVYLLDGSGEPVPDGVVGEIVIGGAAVARGYLSRPGLTARRFGPDPFVPGGRLYRTGDLGRRRADGTLEFLGRDDFQVKLRGIRVELDEVEAALAAVPQVREAVVLARPDATGETRLVAYYTPDGEPPPDAARLRAAVAARLPENLVPSAYLRVDRWPLLPNGKVDRSALPLPDAGALARAPYEAPAGGPESAMATLWADLLGVARVGRHDNFFALGGHSLLAMKLVARVREAFDRDVSPVAVFATPTLAQFTAALEPDGPLAIPPVRPAARTGALPVSSAQRRLWFLAQWEGVSATYHVPIVVRLTGALDRAALARAWDAVVERHEALRTRFVAQDGEAFCVIDPPVAGGLRVTDLAGTPRAAAALETIQRDEATAPFDLAAGPLCRARLVALGEEEHVLLLTAHHIVCDGWSVGVLIRELSDHYTAFHSGGLAPLPPLPVQYADFAVWQRDWLAGPVLARQEEYWRAALAGAPALLELPTDHPRPREPDYRGGFVPWELDASTTAALKALAAEHGGTLFMPLLAALAVVLSRLSGQADVVIGTPTANRRRAELEPLVGFFANTLALRVELSGAPDTRELLRRVHAVTVGALEHQDLPFEHVVELLNPGRSLSHAPVFQVMFTWQSDVDPEWELPGVRATAVSSPYPVAKFDLTAFLGEQDGRVVGGLNYATALFEADTVRRLGRYLRRVLEAMLTRPLLSVTRLPLLDEQERRHVLGPALHPPELGLRGRFAAAAAAAPDAVATVHDGQTLTYRELVERANRLAHHLRERGVGPDSIVALCLERSPRLIVALVAIMRAGGAYVPLDPRYPTRRLADMVGDCAPVLVLAEPATAAVTAQLGAVPVVDLVADAPLWSDAPTTPPQVRVAPDHLAYVLYTSGSTGRPKGVAQTWRCADNLVHWMGEHATPGSPTPARVLQFAPISFDVSFQEIWSTLCRGATLVSMTEESRHELGELRRFIASHGVQRAFLPAAVLHHLAGLDDPAMPAPAVPCEVVTAGEALHVTAELRALLGRLGGRYLHNHYGPTETHVATSYTLDGDDADWPELPPIGRPVPGIRVYVLDEWLEPVPVGVVGELYVSGVQLARGYLNRPGLTADRFLPDPFGEPGGRMYRTGDLGRRRADGELEYVGRADDQVKVRGFRVELGEVESVLRQAPGVRQAAVALLEGHLVGYVVGDARPAAWLRTRLPEHMVPTRWVTLERLPLTRNGKVDRRALPEPEPAESEAGYQPPRTWREARLAAIWAEVLGRDRVGVTDDFFALGGHSLLATRLVHAVNQRMSARLSLRALFATPVLGDLAALLERDDEDPAAAFVFPPLVPDPAGRHQPFPLTDMQQAYWVGREATVELGGVGAHGYREIALPSDFDVTRFTRALRRLIDRHDMLRAVVRPDGTQQVRSDVPPYEPPCVDLRGLGPDAAARRLAELRHEKSHHVFDPGRWPLFEYSLTLLDDETLLHVSTDALIVDVASGQILERELIALFADPQVALPEPGLSFRDYVLAEQALRTTPRYERAERYWRERAARLAPPPELPLARTPESIEQPRFTRRLATVPAQRWSALKAIARGHAVTPSALLLTAFAQVLARWSRHSRFTLSLPLFNRLPLHPDINAVVGDFTSLVLLEVDVPPGVGFADRCRATQERLWQDIDHAAVSGVWVNRERSRLQGTRQQAVPIVFNSTLSELSPESEDIDLAAGLGGRTVHGITQTPQVWLDHTIMESAGELLFNWDSVDELFPDGLMAEMFADYGLLLDRLAESPDWQSTMDESAAPEPVGAAVLPEPALLHELVDRQALATPQAVAVLAGDRAITYAELRGSARHLAGRLQERGAGPGEIVAVLADRGWEQVVATVGILYAGAAYLPLDPEWPPARLASIVGQAGVRLALTQPGQPVPPGVEALVVDPTTCGTGGPESRPVSIASTALAYVIFTSGSTGVPKGVMIDHRGAVNTLLDINRRFGIGPADRVLALSSLSFDLSVYDIFGTLAAGAAVVTLDPALARDPAHWLDLCHTHRVSVWNSVPALLRLLVEYASQGRSLPPSLRLAMLSGDWIPLALPERARELHPGLEVHSLGGATEASIWSIHFPIGEVDPAWRSIPYGRALSNQSMHVLDEALRPRPTWATGTLYIGGIGLALGYLGDEAATAAAFITHPVTGERLYRTGDLGRYRPGGIIEILGREDEQVKVHGYRIELGEIEAALCEHPDVRAAAVRVWGEPAGQMRLAAYVVAPEGIDATLAEFLASRLPAYLVPASFTILDALPLSANAKVDKSRLPLPSAATAEPDAVAVSPDEARLLEIVAEILDRGPVPADANLLRLGATSIDIVRIANATESRLGFRPRLAELMRAPSLATLLRMYREHRPARTAPPVQLDDPGVRSAGTARVPARRTVVDADSVELPVPAGHARRYAQLRSVRRFAAEPVDVRALGGLLACLAQGELDGAPKYQYGSAGGAYPVQTYCYAKPSRVAGLAGGPYYHDPVAHRLVRLRGRGELSSDAYDYFVNRPVFESAAFALFLVAELAAIEPLYGSASLEFCRIEAGAMAQLLTMSAVDLGLGLCGMGSVEADLAGLFELGGSHRLVYSMLGGVRPAKLGDAMEEIEL